MRCSVSELAPGVNGITTVIGRDDRSSARASSLAVTVTARTAAKTMDARDMLGLRALERSQSAVCIFHIDVAWLGNQMIQCLERHLDDVVVGIVGNAEQRQPLRFDLIAKAQRGDLDFGLFAFERGRDAIEERAPLLFVELAGGHGESPIWDKVRNGSWGCSACPDCE